MRTVSLTTLRGPNTWSKYPVLHALVETQLDRSPPDDFDRIRQNLALHLPKLCKPNGCSTRSVRAECTAAVVPSEPQNPAALLLQDLALELQAFVGQQVHFGTTHASQATDAFIVVVQYDEEIVGRACVELACVLCQAALERQHVDLPSELTKLRQFAENACYGIRTALIANAARARGIPVRRLDRASLIQLGHGVHQQRFRLGFTGRTSAVGESIALDKHLTKSLLMQVGVPVPRGRLATDPEDAWTAACELGLPAVLKPRDADYGNGISLNLKTREQVIWGFEKARAFAESVIVETFATGAHHRILVAGDRIVAAVRRTPPIVVGDGRLTIRELVDEANKDPTRGEGDDVPFDKLPIDSSVLTEQGYQPDSVPPAGAVVVLEREAKGWWYAVNQDVTPELHGSVAAHCITAARVIGLDLAGVDIIAESIDRPLEEQGGVVLEINAEPGILQHLRPWCDHAQPIGEGIVESLFPLGQTGCIPLVAVTGTGDPLLTTKMTAHLLRQTDLRIGVSCSEGVYLDHSRIMPPGPSEYDMARAVLFHPKVELGVIQASPAEILRDGLGIDRGQVVIVCGSHNPRQKPHGDTNEQLASATQVVVNLIDATGFVVLDVDDPQSNSLADDCAGTVIYLALNNSNPRLDSNLKRGGRIVELRGAEMRLTGCTFNEQICNCSWLVEMSADVKLAVMGGVAAAWAMRLPVERISQELATLRQYF